MNDLLVLAGGFGTRLRSVIDGVPKPLAPIGDVPFLFYQIDNWVMQGAERITFLLHYRADQIVDYIKYLKRERSFNCELNWISEVRPLNTGGAVANAVKTLSIDQDFLVANADTWLTSGLRALSKAKAPSIGVVKVTDTGRFGRVCLDKDAVILKLVEKEDLSVPGWINAGLYKLCPDLFASWNEKPLSLERDLFTQLVRDCNLFAVKLEHEFIDIGTPDDYLNFCKKHLKS